MKGFLSNLNLPAELYIAARYTFADLKQSLMIAFAVGLGVAIIIFIPSVNLSFFNYFVEETVENSAHIHVTREIETMPRNRERLQEVMSEGKRVVFADQTLTRKRNIKAYKKLMDELESISGVRYTSPFVSEEIIITHGSQVRGASLEGVQPEREQLIRNLSEDIAVGNIFTIGTNEVFLGWRLADELGVNVGNRIKLVTSEGNKSFKVAGLVNSGMYATDMNTVLISLRSGQNLLDMANEVTGIKIRIADIYEAQNISNLIGKAFQLKTRNWMEDNEVMLDQIQMFRVIIAFISFLIVFAAASSITSVLIMVVASKSKEIGILKAMGMKPRAIMRMFLMQAIFLAVIGSLAGVLGGQGLIEIYNATPYAKAETFLGISRQPVTMNMEYMGYAIFYAMLSSIIASLFPAWHASRLDPVTAINQ